MLDGKAMSEVRAFVGHSFADEDAELVASFLKYFDQIKILHPAFSWENAEAAEPRDLAKKVFALLADKNVFIGICTKKEQVINPALLQTSIFHPHHLKAKDREFEWKTSDWMVQEIGLAIGRGLDLILLIEKGIRSPGDLQGNVEYITFERSAPERVFGKIVEMIHALSPRPIGPSGTSTNVVSIQAADTPEPTSTDWMTPAIGWDRGDYRRAVFFLMLRDDVAGVEKMSEAYLATAESKQDDNAAEWGATVEFLRISYGKGGSLRKLREMTAAHPTNESIHEYLALAQSSYSDHSEAAKTYVTASAIANSTPETRRLQQRAAAQYARAGEMPQTWEIVERLKSDTAADVFAERQLLDLLREIFGILKDVDAELSAMERIVDIAADDINTRFSLAYKHSENGNDDLALHHYLKIPHNERGQFAWNNLGVVFDRFSMPGKSVAAYRMAEEMGETLAMSNLGYKLMNAGFLDEARAEFDKAIAIKDFNKNVGTGLAALKEVPDEEDKKQGEALERSKAKAEFYKFLGREI